MSNEKAGSFSITDHDGRLHISGMLDAVTAGQLAGYLKAGEKYILDFEDVTGINFAGQRALVRACNKGMLFNIVNASREVAEAFESSGLSSLISVCRKPVPYDISGCEIFGGGAVADSYNCADEDAMMKLDRTNINQSEIEREKRYAQKAFIFGIPTPISGDIISVGDRRGLLFERIQNKKSMSRVIADDPSQVEKYAEMFAKMSRDLHSTVCDKAVFPSAADTIRKFAENSKVCTDEEKKRILAFIDGVEKKDTCLHGDLHMGNVIITEHEALFIDMADFSYGNPLFDIGMLYYVTNKLSKERTEDGYHNTKETMRKFWVYFVKYYYGAETESGLAEVEKMVRPFAGLRILWILGKVDIVRPERMAALRELLLDVV